MNYEALLKDAYKLAVQSPDPSTQIGAFLVSPSGQSEWLTMAYNRPVRGYVMLESDWERPRKYALLEHAERNCLYNAARNGICTVGCTMVASWAACADCARAIVETGIDTLVRHYPPLDEATERWLESVSLGDDIMKAGGVNLVDFVGSVPGAPSILRNGKLFDPVSNMSE
jgi:dCMP deaminase